jgi:UDP-galactopyranose mutase
MNSVPYDYLVVGAGFCGSVCAQQMAEAGKKVLVIDKRDHIAALRHDALLPRRTPTITPKIQSHIIHVTLPQRPANGHALEHAHAV